MNLRNRWVQLGIAMIVLMVLLSLLFTPQSGQMPGSTYSRAPNGYGAWYAYLEKQHSVQRWQRPLPQLFESSTPDPPVKSHPESPVKQITQAAVRQTAVPSNTEKLTLIRIGPDIASSHDWNSDWIKQGNRLILVGLKAAVTQAPFRSQLPSAFGAIQVETTRRFDVSQIDPQEPSQVQPRLQDAYGTVVWQEKIGQGAVIRVVPPYLAANAYQDQPGNFQFLAGLATESGYPIYIDEYLHGYKDRTALAAEQTENVLSYLARTPLLLVAIQFVVLFLVLIWGQKRFGPPQPLTNASIDNHSAYIQALATVLHRANCGNFVIQTIGKAEQLQIQQALGLSSTLLDSEALLAVWQEKTGQSAAELAAVITPSSATDITKMADHSRQVDDRRLLLWLKKWQTIRRQLE